MLYIFTYLLVCIYVYTHVYIHTYICSISHLNLELTTFWERAGDLPISMSHPISSGVRMHLQPKLAFYVGPSTQTKVVIHTANTHLLSCLPKHNGHFELYIPSMPFLLSLVYEH